MDYTLFILSAAKESYETHADPEHAMVVRLVLLPALLRIGHHHSWHLPRWLARVSPRTRFSH
jgi:uncharacterized membrane protein YdfJ with MMPL/SSD domain